LLSPWPALRAQLVRSTQTLAFQQQFEALARSEPTLIRFIDPPALLDALHGPDGDADARNAILAALVRQAKTKPEPATTLLLLALWPGLDAAYRRLARHFAGRSDHLVSEISARMVAGVRGLNLTRVHRIAATLIRNCQRDVIRSLKQRATETKIQVGLEAIEFAAPPKSFPASSFGWDDEVRRLVARLRPVLGADAPLVVAIAVMGERQHDAAAALGLSHDAGRKRYQRALKRVRVIAEEIF
jgi:RNA polymerase sigma-70 factor (ECF subfamily)